METDKKQSKTMKADYNATTVRLNMWAGTMRCYKELWQQNYRQKWKKQETKNRQQSKKNARAEEMHSRKKIWSVSNPRK